MFPYSLEQKSFNIESDLKESKSNIARNNDGSFDWSKLCFNLKIVWNFYSTFVISDEHLWCSFKSGESFVKLAPNIVIGGNKND